MEFLRTGVCAHVRQCVHVAEVWTPIASCESDSDSLDNSAALLPRCPHT